MDRVVVGLTTAASMMGAGVVVIGQSIFDPEAVTWERVVGGSVLIFAAIFIARYSITYIREIRNGANEDRKAWADDRKALTEQLTAANQLLGDEREAWAKERSDILEQLDASRLLIAELSAALEREKDLRASLERAGIADRRTRDDIESTPGGN